MKYKYVDERTGWPLIEVYPYGLRFAFLMPLWFWEVE
jgi:hypothetical protein